MSDVKCPKCGRNHGYYVQEVIKQTRFIDFDGEPFEAHSTHIRGAVKKYCATSHKDITNFVDALPHQMN